MGSVDRENALAAQLIQAGNHLLAPSPSVDSLLSLLDEIETLLSNVEQEPATLMQDALFPSMKAFVSTDILKHENNDVRVSVASCITEITRITAPDAPYNDDQMKEVFELTVEALGRLADASDPCYKKAELIIDTVSKVRSCLLMLDLECNELILEMVRRFFEVTRCNPDHPPGVISAMETIMAMVIDESEYISPNLLDALLANVMKEIGSVSPVSLKLGEKVLASCGHKLKPYVVEALTSTGNSLDIYSPVVATILQTVYSSIEEHKSACPEEKEKDEKISTNGICSSEPLEGTVEQATRDNTKLVVTDATFLVEKKKNTKMENSLNTTKGCSTRRQFKRKDAEAKSETLQKKRGLKPNMPSSKKRRKRTTDGAPTETRITKDPLSTNTTSCSTKSGQTGLSLPILEGGFKGPRKRRRVEIKDKSSDQGDSLPLSALKKGESDVNIKDDPLLIDAAIKVEPAEEYGSDPKRIRTRESIIPTENKKSFKKTKTESGMEEVVVQVPVIEAKVKRTGGKQSLVSSDRKRKKPEAATSVTESSSRKKLKSPVTTKPSRKRVKETPEDNSKEKQSAEKEKEVDSKLPGPGDELVGRRIKVWWPLDKTFYEGIVNLYDNVKKKHQVLYADGETELLNLKRQRWELIQDDLSAKEEQAKDHESPITLSEILQKHKEKRRKELKNHVKAGSSAQRSSDVDIARGTDRKGRNQSKPGTSRCESGTETQESEELKPKECNLMKSLKESECSTLETDGKPRKPKNSTPEVKDGIVQIQKPKTRQRTKRTGKQYESAAK